MALSVDDIKASILLEIGDLEQATGDPVVPPATGLLAAEIDRQWERYAAKDQIGPGLRELYTKRALLLMALAVVGPRRFDAADTGAGLNVRAGQIWEHLNALAAGVRTDIRTIERQWSASGRAYKGGQLTTTAPVTPPCPPDANDPKYGGSPYAVRAVGGETW